MEQRKRWQEGIEFSFSKVAFRDAWTLIKFDTFYYTDFTRWVSKLLNKSVTVNSVSQKEM